MLPIALQSKPQPSALPWETATGATDQTGQAIADPLQPTAADGWSPATITAVTSKDGGSYLSSALHLATGGVAERPGQRLSVAQVDALAPYYASVFHIDESRVREELSKVYLYVGGPAAQSGQAMTVGHHIFLPDTKDLHTILSPNGKRWLSHELSHTMQFVNYDGSSSHGFLASYVRSFLIGKDPATPGSGSGPLVWGAAFTGWRTSTSGYGTVGKPSTSLTARAGYSIAPAMLIGVPLALTAGGGLAALRATLARTPGLEATSTRVLGNMHSVPTAMAVIAAPALLGSVAGIYGDKLGTGQAQALGAIGGGGIALATLGAAKAFAHGPGSGPLRGWGTTLAAVAAVAGATGIGWLTARVSSNTISGWSRNSDLLRAHMQRENETPGLQDALHDSHWEEIEAEAIAQEYVAGAKQPIDTSAYAGVEPTSPSSFKKRLDWGLWNPLTIGVPAAAIAGTAVVGGRTGMTLLKSSIREGKGPVDAVRAAYQELRGTRRGYLNSFSIGGAVTVAPLMVGGIVAPIAASLGLGSTTSRLGGAAAASVVSGVILTGLLSGRGGKLITTTPKVLAGMAIAGGVGLLGANLAYDATNPHERQYDVRAGVHAAH